MRRRYLERAEPLRRSDALNVLLSHNPDVIAAAAAKGFEVTLAGHTHGGQVTLEFLHPGANVARYYTPYVYGRYEVAANRRATAAYVTRGVGTIFVPARLGAPPELASIRLRTA
jgi:predicted MPP superfamily phosphohydrolase